MKKVGRNERCPCGSAKKFKNCCAGKQASPGARTPLWLVIALAGVVGLGATGLVASLWRGGELTPNRVWSSEHGHWHTVGGGSEGAGLPSRSVPQPPGPVPPGKVWSPEHGHWHDAR